MMESPACDSHVHVFDPARFAYSPSRKFTPDTASATLLTQYLDEAGMARVVLVQPSVYGTDNRCMVDAIGQLGPRAKGIAVVSPQVSADELHVLSAAGVVGARLNMVVNRSGNAAEACAAVQALDETLPKAWHIQLHVPLDVLLGLAPVIQRSQRRFVLDHMGLPAVQEGTETGRWSSLLTMLRAGQLHVKLSAPYLSSCRVAPYADVRPFVESLVQARPDAVVWGSNWPHTQGVHRPERGDLSCIETFRNEDRQGWSDSCTRWLGAELMDRLHANAARLYGWSDAPDGPP